MLDNIKENNIPGKAITITVAFKKVSSNSKLISKLISFWTNSKYYHTEIILDDLWISATEGIGVTINDLEPLKNTWTYVELGTFNISKDHFDTIIKWIKLQEDKKYDWMGIYLSQILPFRMQDNNKWFCSEIVTKILQMFCHFDSLELTPNLTSPGMLAKVLKLEEEVVNIK